MPLPPLYGHELIRNRLAGAIASGRLPQALLFEGPRGVGKQRLALWLAQAVHCETLASSSTEPCGSCRACRLVLTLSHPDVHWFIPLELDRKAADADKQVELAEGALAEELAVRRERPLYEPPGGMASHGLASVRLLLRRLVLTPVLGNHKVFIIGDAERLIPQQANPEAANALLKALEEPPADTVFVLTASEPEALLPTVRSRVVRVRVPRVPDSVVTSFVQKELKPSVQGQELAETVGRAGGCIGRVLAPGERGERVTGGFPGAMRQERKPASRYALALKQMPFQARGGFTGMLDELLAQLRAEAQRGETAKVVEAIAQVLEARDLAQGNVNPQLLTAVLGEDLAEERR